MQTYLVGGAVRDQLLASGGGHQHSDGDRDWVVVGATPEEMIKAGYTPVGRDFPVFLHPKTREEYALARTERKRAPGYHGFVFHAGREVTLEDDLARRDLTINAMAMDDRDRLIDLHGGARDLRERLLRHVSPAFAEDPVRILRLARFAARWPDFTVADDTLALCRAMVQAGEVDALVAERVWQELARGLMEARPSRMVELLRDCGALQRLLPEVDRLFGVPQRVQRLSPAATAAAIPDADATVDTGAQLLAMLDMAARLDLTLTVRYGCLGHEVGKGLTPEPQWPDHAGQGGCGADLLGPLSQRLRVPAALRELAELVAREHAVIHAGLSLDASAVMRLLQRCDAWRRPERFAELLLVCECAARAQPGQSEQVYTQRQRLAQGLAAAQAVDASAVVAAARAQGLAGPALARALDQAREQALCQAGWPAAGDSAGTAHSPSQSQSGSTLEQLDHHQLPASA
ncbi:MAG: multifunctional CCA addition/repair protein [Burkholderiales bacterium]|nr:multifunctional CCA addition/repair protein [Burkholderiales bacterium]